MSDDVARIEERASEREQVLMHCADLFDEVATFMDEVCKRTFAAYDTQRDKPVCGPLMRKHRQALSIRDDYRGLARENREDAEIYASLRQHLLFNQENS